MNENFVIVKKSSLYCDSKGVAGSRSSPTNYMQKDDVASSIKTQAFCQSAKNSVFVQLEIVGQKSLSIGMYSERDGKYFDHAGRRRNTTMSLKNNNTMFEEGNVEEMRVSKVAESNLELQSMGDEKY